jgi:cobalt-zinc-cadmium efflux system membrane fusion protein
MNMTPAAEPSSPTSTLDDTDPSSLPVPTVRQRKWRLAGILVPLVGLVAAGAFWALHHGSSEAASAAEPLDTPRVEGKNIVFSAAFAERAGVRFAPVVRAALVPVVQAVGTIDFNPEHVAAVGARLRGLVTQVKKFEGDSVEPGTVLAVIESAELGEAQASVSTLEAEKQAADRNLQRESQLVERKLSTAREAEVAAVEAERYQHLLGAARQKVAALVGGTGSRPNRLGAHELRSPLGGTVVERSVAPGQSVEGEMVAFRVANLDHLWLELEVFEKNIGLVKLGDRVELAPLAAPTDVFEGRVAKVGAVIDSDTRSAPVRVEINNSNGRLRAGQAVNASIHATAGHAGERLLVPSTALTFVDGKPTLFVATGEHSVRVASVELGRSNGTQTEVLSGLDPSDRVVSEGAFALKSELYR